MSKNKASTESPEPISSSSSSSSDTSTASSSKSLASPSPDGSTSSSSSYELVTEEQAVTNASTSSNSSSSSAEPSESAFDKLLKTSPVNKLPDPKPQFFKPVLYDWQEPPTKFRRLIVKDHEKEIKEQLAGCGLTKKQIEEYAKSAAYFPGVPSSEYKPLDDLPYLCSPGKISLSSSESGVSPKFDFYKTPPQESSSTVENVTSPLASSERTRATTPERSPVVNVFKTPSRPTSEVDNLSPNFERMKVKSGKKCYGRAELSDSPLARSPQVSDGPESPSFSPKATSTTGLEDQENLLS